MEDYQEGFMMADHIAKNLPERILLQVAERVEKNPGDWWRGVAARLREIAEVAA